MVKQASADDLLLEDSTFDLAISIRSQGVIGGTFHRVSMRELLTVRCFQEIREEK